MADEGLIILGAFSSVPAGFARTDGSAVSRSVYSGLFGNIGTTFGAGDGFSTFNLPSIQSRVVNGYDNVTYHVGDRNGETTHALAASEMAAHQHGLQAAGVSGTLGEPTGNDLASAAQYDATSDGSNLRSGSISVTGAGQPHNNMQPYIVLQYLIALQDPNRASTPGEIRLYAYSTTPTNHLPCDGSAVSRSTYAGLFSLIGTTFGVGNGTTTFNVPDLRARVPLCMGQGTNLSNYPLAGSGGADTVTLNATNLPAHSHTLFAVSGRAVAGQTTSGPGNALSKSSSTLYAPGGSTLNVTMGSTAIRSAGGGGAHNNLMPTISLAYFIAYQ